MKKTFFFNTGFLFIPALFFVLLFYVVVPELSISFYSSKDGTAQILFPVTGEENVYSIKQLKYTPFKEGMNTFHYSLPVMIGKKSTPRWDPIDKKDASIALQSVTINIAGQTLPLAVSVSPISGLTPEESSEKVTLPHHFSWITTSNDPQLRVIFNNNILLAIRVITPLIILAIALPFLFLITRKLNSENNILEAWLKHIDQAQFFREYVRPLFIFLIIAVIFHLYEITHFMLSVDDEFTALRTDALTWAAQGRWVNFFIEQYVLKQPVMPHGTVLISLFFMSLSYLLLIHFLGTRINWKVYLTFPIFSSFPTLWFINEFYGNMVPTSFGFFLVALSCWWADKLTSITASKNNKLKLFGYVIIPSSLFFAASIGCYQSFATLFPVFFLAKIIFSHFYPDQIPNACNRNIHKKHNVRFNQKTVVNALVFPFGLLLYFAINKTVLWQYDLHPRYVTNIFNPDFLFLTPYEAIQAAFEAMVAFYSGSIDYYGVSLSMAAFTVLLALGLALAQPARKSINKFVWLLIQLCFLLLLTSPFLLIVITRGLPFRSYVAIPSAIWFCAFFLLNRTRLQEKILYTCILLFLNMQIIVVNGQYAAASNLVLEHDKLLADNIYTRLVAANPSFDYKKPIVLDVYGWKYFGTKYPSPYTSTMSSSFFFWDLGNIKRMVSFMTLIGYDNIKILDNASRKKLTKKFEKMPVWPAAGSVVFTDGVYMVKLGDIPDFIHMSSE